MWHGVVYQAVVLYAGLSAPSEACRMANPCRPQNILCVRYIHSPMQEYRHPMQPHGWLHLIAGHPCYTPGKVRTPTESGALQPDSYCLPIGMGARCALCCSCLCACLINGVHLLQHGSLVYMVQRYRGSRGYHTSLLYVMYAYRLVHDA